MKPIARRTHKWRFTKTRGHLWKATEVRPSTTEGRPDVQTTWRGRLRTENDSRSRRVRTGRWVKLRKDWEELGVSFRRLDSELRKVVGYRGVYMLVEHNKR